MAASHAVDESAIAKKRVIGRIACSFCRSRKAKCIIDEYSITADGKAACRACIAQGVPCVFGERRGRGPGKRRRTRDSTHDDVTSGIRLSTAENGSHSSNPLILPSNSMSQVSSISPDSTGDGVMKSVSDIHLLPTGFRDDDESVTNASKILQQFSEQPSFMNRTGRFAFSMRKKDDDSREKTQTFPPMYSELQIKQILSSFDLYRAISRPLVPLLHTDLLCPRPLVDVMLRIFLNQIYPVCPVVHRPTFVRDLNQHREQHDRAFFAFIIRLCGLVLATTPRKFSYLKKLHPNLRFNDFREMHQYCQDLSEAALGFGWQYDCSIDGYLQWGCAYLSMLSGGYAESEQLRVIYYSDTCETIIRALGWNVYPDAYEGQNCIEIELRKRALCLTLFKTLTQRMFQGNYTVRNANNLGITDPTPFLPTSIDDEYITVDAICPPSYKLSSNKWPIICGFISNVKAHLCIEDFKFGNPSVQSRPPSGESEQQCIWRLISATSVVAANLPPPLAGWKDSSFTVQEALGDDFLEQELGRVGQEWYAETPDIYESQMETSRANVHITLLMIRNVLLTLLEKYYQEMNIQGSPDSQEMNLWVIREDICQNLIRIFRNISLYNIEANGLSVIFKIRSIAASLINYPAELKTGTLRKVESFLTKLVDLTVMLDASRGTESEDNIWRAVMAESRLSLDDL